MWALGGLLATGCAEPEDAEPAGAAKPAPPPVLVTLDTVRAGSITDGWSFLGRVDAALAAEIGAAVSGHVLSVRAREGDSVAKGAVLLTIDSAKTRAALAAARARRGGLERSLSFSRRQFERVKSLEYPTISEPERERYEREMVDLEAQLATQEAELQRLQVELNQHTLRAPFAGVVRSRHVDPGAWVNIGQPMLGLVSLDNLEIHADVSDSLAGRVEVGQTVTVRGAGAVNASLQTSAEVAGVVGALDPETRTMPVRLIPSERPDWLLAGMAVDVEFPVTIDSQAAGAAEGAVIVSRDAIIQGPVGSRVVKHVDGQGVPISVEILGRAGTDILVRGDGLMPGDEVVVRGNERLRPGQPLKVAPSGREQAGAKASPKASPSGDPAAPELGGRATGEPKKSGS
ncbi:MAG: efflux RND transporter periplasmic adaptor subunit [Haliangiales bacterium]